MILFGKQRLCGLRPWVRYLAPALLRSSSCAPRSRFEFANSLARLRLVSGSSISRRTTFKTEGGTWLSEVGCTKSFQYFFKSS